MVKFVKKMNVFKNLFSLKKKTKIVHVFLFKGTQNWIIWHSLNYLLPISDQKFVMGDSDEVYTKHKFYIPFDYNHNGYDLTSIRACIEKHFTSKNTQLSFMQQTDGPMP